MITIILVIISLVLEKIVPYGPHNLIFNILLTFLNDDFFPLLLMMTRDSKFNLLDRIRYFLLIVYCFNRFSNLEHDSMNIINLECSLYLIVFSIILMVVFRHYILGIRSMIIIEKEIIIIYFLFIYLDTSFFSDRLYSMLTRNVVIYMLYEDDIRITLYYILQSIVFYYQGLGPCLLSSIICNILILL